MPTAVTTPPPRIFGTTTTPFASGSPENWVTVTVYPSSPFVRLNCQSPTERLTAAADAPPDASPLANAPMPRPASRTRQSRMDNALFFIFDSSRQDGSPLPPLASPLAEAEAFIASMFACSQVFMYS